jgi:hypothetical protein
MERRMIIETAKSLFINNIAIDTKELTMSSKGLNKHHICGCNYADRKNCPWCKKPCHHDASLGPRVLISPM